VSLWDVFSFKLVNGSWLLFLSAGVLEEEEEEEEKDVFVGALESLFTWV
jgi:hypothetical protein